MGEAEAGYLEEFVDELLQPLRFAERDVGIPLAQRRRDIFLVLQEREIPDDGGQRRFQVMRQVDDQVVLPLLRLLRGSGVPQRFVFQRFLCSSIGWSGAGKAQRVICRLQDAAAAFDLWIYRQSLVMRITIRIAPEAGDQESVDRTEYSWIRCTSV
jgi:hypothetical protein